MVTHVRAAESPEGTWKCRIFGRSQTYWITICILRFPRWTLFNRLKFEKQCFGHFILDDIPPEEGSHAPALIPLGGGCFGKDSLRACGYCLGSVASFELRSPSCGNQILDPHFIAFDGGNFFQRHRFSLFFSLDPLFGTILAKPFNSKH